MKEERAQRRHPRVAVSEDAWVLDGADARVQLLNLSLGGAAIRSTEVRPTRSKLRLAFDLESQRMTPRARVVHCSREQEHYCIGLEFEPLSVRDAALIDRLFQGPRGPTP